MSDAKLVVDVEGFRQIQAGRPKWSFVRELVSNAWDEAGSTLCDVSVSKNGNQTAFIRVEDDGPGFANLKDAYTLYRRTDKRSDPTVRGRFNLGEKELVAIAQSMTIETTSGTVDFPRKGGRRTLHRKRFKGTVVTARVVWTKIDVASVIDMLFRFMPPKGKKLIVNGTEVPYHEPMHVEEIGLQTVVEIDDIMRFAHRKTTVEIYAKKFSDDRGWLYEMGVPVQPIDCSYSINVMQKIPMPPNRDTVSDAYLREIYSVALNATADKIRSDDSSEDWIHAGMRSKNTTESAVEAVASARYGDKAVMWSSDTEANERAIGAGYNVVHPRTLSKDERDRLMSVSVPRASDMFGRTPKQVRMIPKSEWTDDMLLLSEYCDFISESLQDRPVKISFYRDRQIHAAAEYGADGISFNLAKINHTHPFQPQTTGLILHELAHRKGEGHFDMAYIHELQRLAGEMIHLVGSYNPVNPIFRC